MLCEICKINQATIHIQEIVNNNKKALHICSECAAKKSQNDPVLQGFNLAEMFYNLSGQIELPFSNEEVVSQDDEMAHVVVVCLGCGWDTTKFRRTGRLGCSKCYTTFKDILSAALENMHRGGMHVGKRPGMSDKHKESGRVMMELMKLQKELDDLIRREEYERAALVRDKINDLKKST